METTKGDVPIRNENSLLTESEIRKPKSKCQLRGTVTVTPINIDHLSESELNDLNYRIVERIRLIHQVRAHQAMMQYHIGDRVCFQPEGKPVLTGTITRYNKKSVSVTLDCGHKWTVAPQRMWSANAQTAQEPTTTVRQVPQPALLPL